MRFLRRFLLLGCLVFPNPAAAATTILLFGDSLVAGLGLPSEDSMSAQLQKILQEKRIETTVINGGVSGETTNGGRARLQWMLNKHKPDLLVIALGGNDLLQGINPAVTRANLDVMLATAVNQKVRTALVAVRAPLNYGADFAREFDVIYPDLAKQYAVPIHPFFLESVFGKREFMQSDGIHPNTAGARLISEELAEFILKEKLVP